ncbi:MAG: helix-turn-helix transcriptional regulator [Anaerolineae bacterium]|nr:helix-turn-helix transcriptional regulator [Anaerolineae bacterium]
MPSSTNIGGRLRNRRKAVNLSLRELARRTDLSASFLSQVEHGKVNASLDSLRRIAEALEVSMLYFLADESAELAPEDSERTPPALPDDAGPRVEHLRNPNFVPLVRAAERPRIFFPDSGATYELLTPSLSYKMEAIGRRMPSGTRSLARPLRVPTEEFIYVVSGVLQVELDTGAYVLGAGDTMYFEGAALRSFSAVSDEDAVWIAVITPPVF